MSNCSHQNAKNFQHLMMPSGSEFALTFQHTEAVSGRVTTGDVRGKAGIRFTRKIEMPPPGSDESIADIAEFVISFALPMDNRHLMELAYNNEQNTAAIRYPVDYTRGEQDWKCRVLQKGEVVFDHTGKAIGILRNPVEIVVRNTENPLL